VGDLNLVSGDSNLEVLNVLDTSQTKSLVNTLHTLAIGGGDGSIGATEVDVQLLQGLVLGLGSVVPDEQATKTTENGEEDVGAVLHVVEHVLGGQTDDEVEQPVGRGHDGDTAGTLAVGEDLLSQNPSDGTYDGG